MNFLCLIGFRRKLIPTVLTVFLFVAQWSWANESAQLKIAVLGGGASGLTAAWTLKKLGYKNVTVFEKENRLGGKVDSVYYQGYPFELGAVWVARDYKVVRKIAKEVGVKFEDFLIPKMVLDPAGNKVEFTKYLLQGQNFFSVTSALMKFHSLKRKFKSEWETGFANASPELYDDFDTFAKNNDIELIAKLFEPFFVACGYGYYKEVPALYYLKLLPMLFHVVQDDLLGKPFHKAGLATVQGGFQEIWTQLGSRLDVQTNAAVSGIQRKVVNGKPIIELTINGQTQAFDRVISSLPLPLLNTIMDVSEEEKQLFSQVEFYNYWVTVFRGENLTRGESLFFSQNIKADTMGKPIVLGNHFPSTDIWEAYQLAPAGASAQSIQNALSQEIAPLGGKVIEVLSQKEWQYFPHVKTENLKGGFYRDLELLQGQQGFSYVGGIMNFESTEHTAEYAKALVERLFGRAR